MSPPRIYSEPVLRGGHWLWETGSPALSVRFVGRGSTVDRKTLLRSISAQSPDRLAWARQIHSDRILEAKEGCCGAGDALQTTRTNLALAVATADCVPVVIASDTAFAVVHAGWRGVASRIPVKTAAAMHSEPERLSAWIGPAIGVCCYEVGFDVAEEIAAASTPEIIRNRPGSRPKVDLSQAIQWQLLDSGVERIEIVDCCTYCNEEWLWSYRRDGESAGRNLTFAWLLDPKDGVPGNAIGDDERGESGRYRVI